MRYSTSMLTMASVTWSVPGTTDKRGRLVSDDHYSAQPPRGAAPLLRAPPLVPRRWAMWEPSSRF
jgi:hypothetical protein